MSSSQHTIELNGKRYDALTGKMIPNQPAIHPSKKTTLKSFSGRNMDGFAKKTAPSRPPSAPQQRPVQKSHTLMRTTVSKPVTHKVHAVATVVSQKTGQPAGSISRAIPSEKSAAKSSLIRRFSPDFTKKTSTTQPAVSSKQEQSLQAALSKTAVEAASVVVNPLHQAIANATSHQTPRLKRPSTHKRLAGKLHVSPRILSGGALLLAALLVIGFFSYQNIPNLKMRLAAGQAGIHGTLPSYQPPGFHLKNISYKTGEVNTSFISNSDSRNFKITQVASAWNSDTLRDKLKTETSSASPVEIPDNGKTLFIYNDSNITWVDGGIWYKIEGDSKLSSDQLLHLANSF